ncbi:hypothetical protein ACWCPF_26050 [Streptomyces sp. NPDC001858]
MTDTPVHGCTIDGQPAIPILVAEYNRLITELAEARATNQRLNYRAQQSESELAAYRRAVRQWEITDNSTYVPLRSIAAIAKAAGIDVPERWELHYQRVERAEAEIQRYAEAESADAAAGSYAGRAEAAERERDVARQHAAAISAQRDRLRQRMNALADRWDHALAPDKPYARTLRDEISCAPFDPEGAMKVQEYRERGRRLWAFRCWGTDTCDGWLGLGHYTQSSALLERERHVAEEHAAAAHGLAAEQSRTTLNNPPGSNNAPEPAARIRQLLDLLHEILDEQYTPMREGDGTGAVDYYQAPRALPIVYDRWVAERDGKVRT